MAAPGVYSTNPWDSIGQKNGSTFSLGPNRFFVPAMFGAGGGGFAKLSPEQAAAHGGTPLTLPGQPSQSGNATGWSPRQLDKSGYEFSKNPSNWAVVGNPSISYKAGTGGHQATMAGALNFLPFAAAGAGALLGAAGAGAAGGAAGGAGAGAIMPGAEAAATGATGGILAESAAPAAAAGGSALGVSSLAPEGSAFGGSLGLQAPGAGAGGTGLGLTAGGGAGAGTGGLTAPAGALTPAASKAGGGFLDAALSSKYLPLLGAAGTSLLLGQRKIPEQSYLNRNQALQGQGLAGITAAQNGQITPSQQAQLDIFTRNQKEQAKQFLESSGQGADSGAYLQMSQHIDEAALAMKQGFSEQLFNQSIQELNISDGATNNLIQLEMQRNQAVSSALSNFALSYAMLGGFGGLRG